MSAGADQPVVGESHQRSAETAGGLLRRAIIGHRVALFGAVALLVGWQAAEALVPVPVLVGVIIDEAVATGDTGALVRWLIVLAALFTALTAGMRFGFRCSARAVEYAGLNLRLRVTRRVLDPRGGTARGRLPGELLSIATEDVSRTAQVGAALAGAVVAGAGLTVAAVVLLNASLQLGLVVLLGLPPVLALLNLLSGPLDRRSTAEQEQAARATAVAGDLISGLRVLKGLRAERAATARYRAASQESLTARLRATKLFAVHSGATLTVTNAFLAFGCVGGGPARGAGRDQHRGAGRRGGFVFST